MVTIWLGQSAQQLGVVWGKQNTNLMKVKGPQRRNVLLSHLSTLTSFFLLTLNSC